MGINSRQAKVLDALPGERFGNFKEFTEESYDQAIAEGIHFREIIASKSLFFVVTDEFGKVLSAENVNDYFTTISHHNELPKDLPDIYKLAEQSHAKLCLNTDKLSELTATTRFSKTEMGTVGI